MFNYVFGSRRMISLRLGQDAVIWVHPDSVQFHFGTISPKKAGREKLARAMGNTLLRRGLEKLFMAEPFVVSEEIYSQACKTGMPIAETETFQRISDLRNNSEDVSRSLWYRHLCAALEKNGIARHKHRKFKSRDEITEFLSFYARDLLGSMERDGYLPRKADDVGLCFIGPEGEIHKAYSGRHRLCAAKLCKIDRFPLKVVGMHEHFFSKTVGTTLSLHRLRKAIRSVEAENKSR